MASKIFFALALAASLGLASPVRPDVWDSSTINDNGNGSTNEITHGFSQVHDLGAQPGPVPDEDWYPIVQAPFSSYEVLCDGFTGDVNTGLPNTLHLVTGAGAEVLPSFPYDAAGYARSLRFTNDSPTSNANDFVRVQNAACGVSCGTNDNYRIRAWDTTIAVPRYNNALGQVTVLIIQNPGPETVVGNAYLWPKTGGTTPVTTYGFILGPRASAVVNLATLNGGVANGTTGTITIASNGRYGVLAVKAVAIEPATGFSFDSPGLYKPVS
jgi:hypothetical protein